MPEEAFFIQRSISHYGAMLKLDLDDKGREILEQLLAEAERTLVVAISLEEETERHQGDGE